MYVRKCCELQSLYDEKTSASATEVCTKIWHTRSKLAYYVCYRSRVDNVKQDSCHRKLLSCASRSPQLLAWILYLAMDGYLFREWSVVYNLTVM